MDKNVFFSTKKLGVFMTLTEQLKILLDNYFEKYPHMSINALAKKSGVGASTLRRIINNSLKGNPSSSTVLNLVSATTKERKLATILKIMKGPIGILLNSSFGHFVEEDLPHNYSTDLNRALGEWPKYLIYKLASNKKGVLKKDIENMLGRVGLKHLEALFEQGKVFMEGEVIHAKEKNFGLDIKVSLKHLPHLLEFFKPDDVDKGKNLFYTLSESLNEDGIQKIKGIQKEAIKKIYNVMMSPYFEGDIPYFSISLMDTLDLEG